MDAEYAASRLQRFPNLTWSGDMGDGRHAFPFVAHINGEYLYVNFAFLSALSRDEAARRIENKESPETVMGSALGSGTHKVALLDIRELRFSGPLNILEIYHGPKNRRLDIQSNRDPIHLWLYSELKERLAPDAKPVSGFLSPTNALIGPVCGLALAVVIFFLFVFSAAIATPDPHHEGLRAGTKELIERFLYKLGVAGAAMCMSIPMIGCISWLVYRWRYPPVAEVFKIPPPGQYDSDTQ